MQGLALQEINTHPIIAPHYDAAVKLQGTMSPDLSRLDHEREDNIREQMHLELA